jgi:hypothetical protein
MTTGYMGPFGNWIQVADTPAAAGSFTPIVITAAEQAAPTAAMIANIFATFQLDVAPYTRYRSDGTNMIAEG